MCEMETDELAFMYESAFPDRDNSYHHSSSPSRLSAATTHHRPITEKSLDDEEPLESSPRQQPPCAPSVYTDPDDEITSVLQEADALLQMLQQCRTRQSAEKPKPTEQSSSILPGVFEPSSEVSLESCFPFLKSIGLRFDLEGVSHHTGTDASVPTLHDHPLIGDAAAPVLTPTSAMNRKGSLAGTLSEISLETLLMKYNSFTLSHSNKNPSTVYIDAISKGVQHRALLRDSALLMNNLDARIQHRLTHMTMWESSVRRWIAEEATFLEQFHSRDDASLSE